MYIYVASPYSIGDQLANVKTSLLAANALIDMGHVPFAPLLSHFWNEITPRSYEDWLKLDFEWIRRCDAVLRIPGESHGADAEVRFAQELGLPVFYGLEAVPPASGRDK